MPEVGQLHFTPASTNEETSDFQESNLDVIKTHITLKDIVEEVGCYFGYQPQQKEQGIHATVRNLKKPL